MIERMGFGTYGLSGAYGNELEEKKAIELIEKAYSLGIRYFDTSPSYGQSELLLGKALSGYRQNIKIATKIGVNDTGFDLSIDAIKTSIDNSLKRIQTDYLDYLFIHYHDTKSKIEDVVGLLTSLKDSGVIKHIGLGHLPPKVVNEYLKYLDDPYLMTEYNIINRLNYKKLIQNNCKNLIAFSITARGVFEDASKEKPPLYIKSVHKHIKTVNKFLDYFSNKYELTKTQLAILFVLQSDNIKYALTGPTKNSHLVENIKADQNKIELKDFKKLISFLKKQEEVLRKEVLYDIEKILNFNYEDLSKSITELTYLIENSAEYGLIDYDQAIESFFKIKDISKTGNLDSIKEVQDCLKTIIKY